MKSRIASANVFLIFCVIALSLIILSACKNNKTTKTTVKVKTGSEKTQQKTPAVADHKDETLIRTEIEQRYLTPKDPLEDIQRPQGKISEAIKREVCERFSDWLRGNLPANIKDKLAFCPQELVPKEGAKFRVLKGTFFPKNFSKPKDWMFVSGNGGSCALYVIFPPYKFDLLREYNVKFVIHEKTKGTVFNFTLRCKKTKGYIWRFYGRSVE